jgi:hypothetical protein
LHRGKRLDVCPGTGAVEDETGGLDKGRALNFHEKLEVDAEEVPEPLNCGRTEIFDLI